jgi:uncharacterized protein YjgD (DUF1641 family)
MSSKERILEELAALRAEVAGSGGAAILRELAALRAEVAGVRGEGVQAAGAGGARKKAPAGQDNARILEEIAALRAEMAPVANAARSMDNLRRDLAPRVEEAVRALIMELAEVESDFQLEDLLALVKQSMRNVKTFSRALDQLGSLLTFVDNVEPLVRQSVPVWISALEELEAKGVFTALTALSGVLEKLAAAYGQEDMEKIGDGLVTLMGLARGLGDPVAADVLTRLAAAPARVRMDAAREMGAWDMLASLGDPAVRRGLGLMIELTRAVGEVPRRP